MAENRKTANSEFISSKRGTRVQRPQRVEEEPSGSLLELKSGWKSVRKKVQEAPEGYRKLARRAMVCAVLALGIWAVKSMDTAVSNQIIGGVESATGSELEKDDDIGQLKFVSGQQGDAVSVSGSLYSLPLEGEVVESFSDSGKDVSIKGEGSARVSAILPGVVVKTTSDSVVVENINGTKSTYSGVIPSVSAGDQVRNSDMLGQLSGEVLCLETVSGIGYVDSLSMQDMTEASAQIE
ncbi:hypothetical protein AALG83_04580 [Christensenellaceae bacterium 44-20]